MAEGLGPDADIVLEAPDVEKNCVMAEGPDEAPDVDKKSTTQDLVASPRYIKIYGQRIDVRVITRLWQSYKSPVYRKLHERAGLSKDMGDELIEKLQQVVYLAVRKSYQKPIEKAADELLKRWGKYAKLLDFDDFDDQVSETTTLCVWYRPLGKIE